MKISALVLLLVVIQQSLRRIKYVYYKDKEITVGFDNVLLNKNVFYDSQKKQLTFKNLPKGLVDELEK